MKNCNALFIFNPSEVSTLKLQ